MKNKKSMLIVGAGLSGICVSLQLLKRGCSVTLVDNQKNVSSRVAVGMINPLVFRRMTKSWRVDEFLPYLKTFYRELEKETNTTFFHPVPIRRLFSSEQERDFWLKKETRKDFSQYMTAVSEEDYSYSEGENPFGSGRVKETYFVDFDTFFKASLTLIKEKGIVINEEFNFTKLHNSTYNDTSYNGVIFCQGYLSKENPFFNDIPIDPTKGQVLTVHSKSLPENVSLNRKCFILPKGKQIFKVGSTYEWHNTTTHITEESKLHILENLSFITDEKVKIIEQVAGVRPTVKDRRPTLGTHPNHSHYHIFNGMGAKGYMIAPLLSEEFVDYLLEEKALDKEVNIQRFVK
tara:strand:- start:10418 stop:11458 length:1041 start_codon:yes stop_codon:yes gene_type:complete